MRGNEYRGGWSEKARLSSDFTMSQHSPFIVRQLTAADIDLFRRMLAMMGEAFGDVATYTEAQPDDAYLHRLLGGDQFIAIAALDGDSIIGGLAAYELQKLEQVRSEMMSVV